MKKRFRVLLLPQAYPIETQVQLVSALTVVHNFICLFNPKDKELNERHIPQETSDHLMADNENIVRAHGQGNAWKHREDIT